MGPTGKTENFGKLKMLFLVSIIPRVVKIQLRSEILHSRKIRKTAISGGKYHLCSMGFPKILNPASFPKKFIKSFIKTSSRKLLSNKILF